MGRLIRPEEIPERGSGAACVSHRVRVLTKHQGSVVLLHQFNTTLGRRVHGAHKVARFRLAVAAKKHGIAVRGASLVLNRSVLGIGLSRVNTSKKKLSDLRQTGDTRPGHKEPESRDRDDIRKRGGNVAGVRCSGMEVPTLQQLTNE